MNLVIWFIIYVGVTSIAGTWSDDFIFADNNYDDNAANGQNWYPTNSDPSLSVFIPDKNIDIIFIDYTDKLHGLMTEMQLPWAMKMDNYMDGGPQQINKSNMYNDGKYRHIYSLNHV